MKRLRLYLSTLHFHRPALIESGKILFALIGVGTIVGNLAVMRFWQFPIALAVVGAVWFALYVQMEGVTEAKEPTRAEELDARLTDIAHLHADLQAMRGGPIQ